MRIKCIPLVVVLLTMAFSGCAGVSHVPLSEASRSDIRAVSINDVVKMPENVFFFGTKEATFGVLGGGLGAAIGEGVLDDKAVLKKLLEDNNIQVGQIFRSELKSQLEKTRVFPQVVDQGGDAHFSIEIANYGLFKKGAFNGALRAAIWANISLIKPDGTVVWQKSVRPAVSEDRLPAHDLNYYQEHPEALRRGFEMLSAIQVTELINDLKP